MSDGIQFSPPVVLEVPSSVTEEVSPYNLWDARDKWASEQESLYKSEFRGIVKDELAVQYGDMFRHTYVSARFADSLGSAPAFILGLLNELDYGLVFAANRIDSAMDIHNNAVGREIAQQTGGVETTDFLAAVWLGVMEGRFLILKEDKEGNQQLERTSAADIGVDGDRLDDSYRPDLHDSYDFDLPGEDHGPYDC